MAVIYAYFDESGKHKDHPVVSFSGVCGTESRIKQFEVAWNALLRQHGLSDFKMTKALQSHRQFSDLIPKQTPQERVEALKPFADCICDNLELGLMQAWDVQGFNALSKDTKAKLGAVDDPYYLGFNRGVLGLVDYVQEDDRISLICDDDAETAWDCYLHYCGMRRANDDVRKKTIALSFADDKYFPALQGADFVAALNRLEAERRFYGFSYLYRDLEEYMVKDRGPSKMQWREMFAPKEKMISMAKVLEKKK